MTGREFRDALRSGRNVCGTLLSSSSPRMFDLTLGLGLDFVFLCNEHVFYNQESLGWMCRAYRASGINPVVRILKPDPYLATQALDSGAQAILVPYAEDIEAIRDVVGAVKYRPLKGEKLRRIIHGEEPVPSDIRDYLKKHNQNNTLLLNIESQAGIDNMDLFFALQSPDGPGIDGIVIGPHDLSISAGMPEEYNSERFLTLSCSIIRKARNAGVAAGGHTGFRKSIDLQMEWAKAGANILLHSSDMMLFADGFQEEMNRLREVKGEKTLGQSKAENV